MSCFCQGKLHESDAILTILSTTGPDLPYNISNFVHFDKKFVPERREQCRSMQTKCYLIKHLPKCDTD